MIDKIRRHALSHPNSIAYKIGHHSITYSELFDKASIYADLLKKQGSSPVIIYGKKSLDTVISILACIIAGRTYIPLDMSSPISRIEIIASLASSTLVLTNEAVEITGCCCIPPEKLSVFEKLDEICTESNIVYIIFTSGTTGVPKGVPISKENLNNFIDWISSLRPLCEYSYINVMNQAEFCFDLSVADLFYSLCNGHRLVSYEPDKGNVAEFIKKNEINVAVITPTFARLCLLDDEFCENYCPSLKCIYFCGETLDKKTVERLFTRFSNIKIINAYGPTEATSAVSATEITRDMLFTENTLPIGNTDTFATEITIDDGEIILQGKSVFGGYLKQDSPNCYKSCGCNFYRTGDLGHIKDGKLYYNGRKDLQIKYKGYRIELCEIENNLLKINRVTECVVIPKYSVDGTVKAIWAFVTVEGDLDEVHIKKKLSKIIPSYMIPKKIKIVNKLPVNHNQKIDRKALENL